MTTAHPSPFDFTGKRVLITGGTKGLGRATAEAFLSTNATVTVCARSAPEESVSSDGRTAAFLPCDVRDSESVTTMVSSAADAMGGLDVLINNAGGAPGAPANESGGSFNEKVVGLNLIGPMNVCVAAYPSLSDGAVIINVSSVSGMRANPMGVAYGAAKAGLINMTQTLALEWGPKIRVLTISAGILETEAARGFLGDDEMDRMASALPMKRLGSADDVIGTILFACSPMASWMTGSNIVIDGGPEWPRVGYQE